MGVKYKLIPGGMPHQISFEKDRYHQIREMIEWCNANFGEGGPMGGVDKHWWLSIAFGKSIWLFRTHEDATMFALRWT